MMEVMKLKIPETIRIGGKEYNIKHKRTIGWNGDVNGQIQYSGELMVLKKGMPVNETESTFFHEVSHGILRELEFNHPKMVKFRNDEVFVQELGLVLRSTFLDLMKKQNRGE